MRKIFTLIAVAATALAANAEQIIDKVQTYEGLTAVPGWVAEGTNVTIVDGCLHAVNDAAKEQWAFQYHATNGFSTLANTDYTLEIEMKSDVAGEVWCGIGNWVDRANGTFSIAGDNAWQTYTVKLTGAPNEDNAFLIMQSGQLVGTYDIRKITLSHDGVAKVIPTDGDVVASWYDGKGGELFGWGAGTRENVEFEGKPCLKFTNDKAVNEWESQVATDVNFDFGKEYFLGFDIKGDAFTGIPVSFQHTDGYKDKGSMTKFDVTPEWSHVIVYGEPNPKEDETKIANRLLLNLGKYVGTFYITNAKLYTASTNSIADLFAPTAAKGVYNLQGIRVADELNGSLPAGLYIVGGKKVLVRNF